MKLTIAYLYYDILNLYGESGNIKALKNAFDSQQIDATIKFLTLDDNLEFDKYDLVYIGAGTEDNQKIVLKHLAKYKDDIRNSIENNNFFLVTGNSIEFFGKKIIDKNDKEYESLNVFDFMTKEEDFRMIDESIFKTDLINNYVIGFQNQGSVMKENKNPMFEVISGIGSYPNSKTEGVLYKNFHGTYLIGPILVRNPEFLKYIVKKIITSKNSNFKFKKWNLTLEKKAYDEFIKNNYENIIIK